jgi:hypothetical protein
MQKKSDKPETPRQKAHRILDEWIDGQLKDLNPDIQDSAQIVNLGYTFAKALTEAKRNPRD